MSPRSRTAPHGTPTPLAVKIVGRAAGLLALLGVAAFIAMIVVLLVSGAGNGHDVSGTPLGSFALNVLLPIMGGSLILSILLALLNQIGVRPWFDQETGRFTRPGSAAAWAIALGGLLAGILIPVTLATAVAVAAVLSSGDGNPDVATGPLFLAILLGGIGTAITLAAVAGGIAVMGWFGVIAGLMLGAGFVGVVIGSVEGSPAAWALGAIGLVLSIATFFAGARLHGTIPTSTAGFAAIGGYLVVGIGFFVYAAVAHDPIGVVGGLAGIAATAGWVIGGRRSRATPLVEPVET